MDLRPSPGDPSVHNHCLFSYTPLLAFSYIRLAQNASIYKYDFLVLPGDRKSVV